MGGGGWRSRGGGKCVVMVHERPVLTEACGRDAIGSHQVVSGSLVGPHSKHIGTIPGPFERGTRTPDQGEAPPHSDGLARPNRRFRPSGGGGGGVGWRCVLLEGSFLKRFRPGLLTAASHTVLLPVALGWAAQIRVVSSGSATACVRRHQIGRFPSVAGCKRRFPLRLK